MGVRIVVWEQFDRIVQNANDIDIANIPRAPKRESHLGLTASYRMAQVIGGSASHHCVGYRPLILAPD